MRRFFWAGLLIGVLAGFYFLDFWVARSQTAASRQLVTLSNQGAKDLLQANHGRELTVYVDAGDGVATAVGETLQRELAKSSLFGEVTFRQQPSAPAAGDVLLVEVQTVNVLWSGGYSRAEVKAEVAYSTTGDVSWRKQESAGIEGDAPAVMARGTFAVADTSWGLLSRLGYRSYLGQQLGEQIAESLLAELKRQRA